jgi:predicted membrane-bound spermidine synthase
MVPRYAYAVIALLSGSLLAYEVLLTRVCALRLHFHFGFLIVSNCLLGIGASGTLLTATERRWRARPRTWIWRSSGLYVMSLVIVWWLLQELRVPDGLFLETARNAGSFALFNMVAAVPFFVGGAAVGLLLSAYAARVHAVYAWDLIGAGAGCIAIPLLLWQVGAGGCFLLVCVLGLVAFAVAAPPNIRRYSVGAAALSATVCLALLTTFDAATPIPGKGYLDLTDDVRRALWADNVVYQKWSANSRIDVLKLRPTERFMFCRGSRTLHLPLPDQKLILQDGSAGTLLSNFSGEPEKLEALRRSLYSLSVSQLKEPRVLVIGMGGGNDVWAAKIHGAKSIRAIELNQAIIDVHHEVAPDFSRALLDDPSIEVVVDEGRSALIRDERHYDLIQMTGIDTWTSLTSGAYILAENYLYTSEALAQMLARLDDGGVLQIIRMSAEMETLRLVSNLDAALGGTTDLSNAVIAFSTRDILTALVYKKGGFKPQEVESLLNKARRDGFDAVYVPGWQRGTVVERFIRSSDKASFIAEFPRDISPTTDDRPYFFNFTRWNDPLGSAEFIDEVASVSQGNPLFILVQLGVSSLLATLFIVTPLVLLRRKRRSEAIAPTSTTPVWRWLAFFGAIGAGFIAIEIALMQKLTLVLGQPLYSIVVTLATILIATGVGSWLSERWLADRPKSHMLGIALLLATMVAAWVALGPTIVDAIVVLPITARLLAAAALVAPMGVLLGVPFAHGIRMIRQHDPSLIPWAWAVNGSATVVGSTATVILSMNAGFNIVMIVAAGIYLLAFIALPDVGALDTQPS